MSDPSEFELSRLTAYILDRIQRSKNGHARVAISWKDCGKRGKIVEFREIREEPIGHEVEGESQA